MSQEAVPISKWLLKNKKRDRGVIGIEPLPHNINCLLNGNGRNAHLGQLNLLGNKITQGGHSELDIKDKFILIEAAVDNVEVPTEQDFYVATPDTGNCSLVAESILHPTNPNSISKKIKVDTISLKYIFDRIDNIKFPIIENLKIDTEGKDLDVLKSAGEENLKKVVFINVECWDGKDAKTGIEIKTASPIIEFLTPLDFELIDDSIFEYKFVNKNLKNLITPHQLTCIDGDEGIFPYKL